MVAQTHTRQSVKPQHFKHGNDLLAARTSLRTAWKKGSIHGWHGCRRAASSSRPRSFASEAFHAARASASKKLRSFNDMSTAISFAHLSNELLLEQLARLAADERAATVTLVATIGEADARQLYLAAGCSSMYVYCTRVLHMAEHAAYHRIEAARLARRFPVVLEHFAAGKLTLTTLRLVAPHLTRENHADLLETVAYKSKREVEHFVAPWRKHEPVPAVVRQSGEDEFYVQFTVSRETYEKLLQAQDLLRHVFPDGNVAGVVDRALTALLGELERRKFAATERPRPPQRAAILGSRHIPSAVKRVVWERDGGQCAFVGTHGRCGERGLLEFHHVKPYAAGGTSVAENIELRCRAHNHYDAELFFGSVASSTCEEDSRTAVETRSGASCSFSNATAVETPVATSQRGADTGGPPHASSATAASSGRRSP